MVGNSLLLPVVGAWMFYVLSNLVALDDPEKLPAAIRESQADTSDDEKEELLFLPL